MESKAALYTANLYGFVEVCTILVVFQDEKRRADIYRGTNKSV